MWLSKDALRDVFWEGRDSSLGPSTNIFASDFLFVPYGLVRLWKFSPEFLEALSSRNEFLSVLRSKFGAKTLSFGFSSVTIAQVVQNRRSKALRARLGAAQFILWHFWLLSKSEAAGWEKLLHTFWPIHRKWRLPWEKVKMIVKESSERGFEPRVGLVVDHKADTSQDSNC